MEKIEKGMKTDVVVATITPGELLQKAIDGGHVSIEGLKMLMDLYDRYQADKARMAFHSALKIFQENVAPIKRTSEMNYKAGGSQVKFKYAGLSEIITTVRPALAKAGLTVRWVNEDQGTKLKVTCFVTHIDGHSESTCMEGEPDTSGAKNAIQGKGSTLTYLQRYTVSMALGIVTEDDLEGNVPDPKEQKKKVPTEKQLVEMKARLEAGTVTMETIMEHFPDLTPEMEAKLIE